MIFLRIRSRILTNFLPINNQISQWINQNLAKPAHLNFKRIKSISQYFIRLIYYSCSTFKSLVAIESQLLNLFIFVQKNIKNIMFMASRDRNKSSRKKKREREKERCMVLLFVKCIRKAGSWSIWNVFNKNQENAPKSRISFDYYWRKCHFASCFFYVVRAQMLRPFSPFLMFFLKSHKKPKRWRKKILNFKPESFNFSNKNIQQAKTRYLSCVFVYIC